MKTSHHPQRYMGLELSGAKNNKTILAILEHYPKEGKTFLLDLKDGIGPTKTESGDEALLKIIQEASHPMKSLGVNVPFTLPPALGDKIDTKSVHWMEKYATKNNLGSFTAYTQRPVELYLKGEIFPALPTKLRFEMDETLGGSRAPLTARMCFLKKKLPRIKIIEALPKLTLALISDELDIEMKRLALYRDLDQGAPVRLEIMDALSEIFNVFVYEKDAQRLAKNLPAFEAFLCAWTAFLEDHGKTQAPPKGFPTRSGWVSFPRL